LWGGKEEIGSMALHTLLSHEEIRPLKRKRNVRSRLSAMTDFSKGVQGLCETWGGRKRRVETRKPG